MLVPKACSRTAQPRPGSCSDTAMKLCVKMSADGDRVVDVWASLTLKDMP
jgi:hypothetical protein